MLRALLAPSGSKLPIRLAGALSIAIHSLVIAASVIRTRPPAGMSPDGISNRIVYLPPPDRPPRASGSHESVHYFTLAPGVGLGPGPTVIDGTRGIRFHDESPVAGNRPVDSTTSAAPADPASNDSVYTMLEVDTAVTRSNISAAPAYPAELIQKRIEGSVIVRFIVDTTGFPDTLSFQVMHATDERFVRPLREVLPRMQFSPAKIGQMKVRQLVEQTFSFKITPPVASAPNKARPE